MRILLVEDEAPLRETLAARLKRDGFAVDAAQDGEEVYTWVAKCRSIWPSSIWACLRCRAWIWSSHCVKRASVTPS